MCFHPFKTEHIIFAWIRFEKECQYDYYVKVSLCSGVAGYNSYLFISGCCLWSMRQKMIVHDSRKRGVLDRDGNKYYIRHRRLQCRDCGCCHSELPDFLLPYKRYSGEVILQIFFQKESRSREAISEVVDCAAENRTIRWWDLWIAASFCQFIIVQVKALQSDSNLLFFLLKSTFQLVHSKTDSIQFQLQFSNVLKLLSCFSGVDCRWI